MVDRPDKGSPLEQLIQQAQRICELPAVTMDQIDELRRLGREFERERVISIDCLLSDDGSSDQRPLVQQAEAFWKGNTYPQTSGTAGAIKADPRGLRGHCTRFAAAFYAHKTSRSTIGQAEEHLAGEFRETKLGGGQ